jgi:hypothetical protein
MTERAPAKRYTADQKREGLIALLVTGSATEAAKQTTIPRKTLETWRNSEAEMYANLSREYGPLITAAVTAQVTESIQGYGEIIRKLVTKLDENTDRIDPRDIPNAIKSVQAAQGQAIDKRQLLTGQATERVEHLDAQDLIADIRKMVSPHGSVDSTAEEA